MRIVELIESLDKEDFVLGMTILQSSNSLSRIVRFLQSFNNPDLIVHSGRVTSEGILIVSRWIEWKRLWTQVIIEK